MKILFTEHHSSRTELEELILAEAEGLGLVVEFRESDPRESSQAIRQHLADKGGGFSQRSGGPSIFNDIQPELIEFVVLSAKLAGEKAAEGASMAVGGLMVTTLWKAVEAKVSDRKLAKAELLDAENNSHRYH